MQNINEFKEFYALFKTKNINHFWQTAVYTVHC